MTWLTAMEYLCHKWPRICSTWRKHFQVLSSFMTDHRMSQVEKELPTLPEHLSSPPGFRWVRVTRSLVMFCGSLFALLSFFFWPLCCLFFFDIRILITPLISSNFLYENDIFGVNVLFWHLKITIIKDRCIVTNIGKKGSKWDINIGIYDGANEISLLKKW